MSDDSLEKMNDPKFATYAGLITPEFVPTPMHAFDFTQNIAKERYYFEPNTLSLRYVKYGGPQVHYSENGLVEKTFTPADYQNY